MTKTNSLLIALMIISVIVKGQNTCINAKNFFDVTIDTLPPVGTISPSGPDYGCLTETGRQLWYYIPVCQTQYVMSFDVNIFAGFGDTVGLIFYGPFSQKVTNCSDLNASKIMDCFEDWSGINTELYLSASSLLEGNYYYALATFSDGIIGNVYPSLTMLNYNYPCYECNNQPSVLNQNDLCLVSVDTAINKCVLTWEEFTGINLMGYTIRRETTLTGVYDSVTTVPLGSMSTYTDMNSSPAQHNITYKVNAVDSCGQSEPLMYSPELTSIHLISYSGGNNQASLIWNNVYTNNNFIPQYYIHRNNNGTGWQVIDSIGITLPTITYTDIFAPAGTNQYTVELRKLVPCVPMRTSSNPYQSVFSNTSLTTVTGIQDISFNDEIKIYPNPAKEFFCIHSNFTDAKEMEVTLFNPYGQKLKTLYTGGFPIGRNEMKFSIKDFPRGIYFVKLIAGGSETIKKMVKY